MGKGRDIEKGNEEGFIPLVAKLKFMFCICQRLQYEGGVDPLSSWGRGSFTHRGAEA